jgi:dCTP deaminase
MQQDWPKGVFPARLIEALHKQGAIQAARPFDADQVQPASLDLRLGPVAFRVRSSFLPGPSHSVAERIEALKLHEIDLTKGAVLERGCVYLVPLQESLALPATVSASANPKSSTGRLDVFTRVIGTGRAASTSCRQDIRVRSIWRSARGPSRCWCVQARGSARCGSARAITD